MRHYPMWFVLLIAVVVSGCAYHRSPGDHAEKFFDHGRHYILKSLKKEDASRAQIDLARAILDRSEEKVVRDITEMLRHQQSVFYAVTTGKDTPTLLSQESALHLAHEQALRTIGAMHAELAAAVGDGQWQAAMRRMENKMSRYSGK